MRERVFLSELGASARAAGWWWEKFPDPSGADFARGAGPVSRRPFDAAAVAPGMFVAVEAKVVRPGGRVVLEPHQAENLAFIERLGHRAIVIARWESGTRLARAFWTLYRDYAIWLEVNRRKGIPFRYVPQVMRELPRLPAGKWDIKWVLYGDGGIQQGLPRGVAQ